MPEKIINKINAVLRDVRIYSENHELPEVLLGLGNYDRQEAYDEYAKVVNNITALKNKMSDIDECIYILYEYTKGISTNTISGQKSDNQIKATLECLKALRRVLEDYDNAYYRIVTYYEKAGIY